MNKQKNKIDPLDKDWFYRWFHLHCFIHIYRILFSKEPKNQFAYPRFPLFKKINYKGKSAINKQKYKNVSLFTTILFTYFNQLVVGAFITICFASFNLLIPQMIKSFLGFMHDHEVNKEDIDSTQILIEGFIVLQLLRIIFGQHSKRLFFQLAVKIQSSLSIMLVKKSLQISHDVRNKISQSQILQLQNIDLRLVFCMFQNMYLAFQAPFTIIVAIYLLYLQNYKYGLIGIYWFVIAFLLQRQLDGKMTHCNDTKLGLIEARSKINYEILGKIKAARLLGYQDLLMQKNNDYFIEQNHDHKLFYEYVTLYDITLILVPILVVVTIALYDLNEPNQISVSQVYVILSLLGICFNPMKSFRTLSINFHDGLRSLKRIEEFLNHQDEPVNQNLKIMYNHDKKSSKSRNLRQSNASLNKHRSISIKNNDALVIIRKHVLIQQESEKVNLKLHFDLEKDLQLRKNERLVIMGKIGSGIESFVNALIGLKRINQGQIILNDKIAFLGQQYFFRNSTVKQNIRFFNQDVQDDQIQTIYKQLKLDEDLTFTKGLQANLDDQYKFTKVQLHKISLARVFCSNAHIYLLDKVFEPLNSEDVILVNQILRKKQSQGKLIILTNNTNNFFEKEDRIIIVNKGVVKNCHTFDQLIQSQDHQFSKFYQMKNEVEQIQLSKKASILSKFQKKVSLLTRLNSFVQFRPSQQQKARTKQDLIKPVFMYAMHLQQIYNQRKHFKIANQGVRSFIWKFLTSVKPKQFIYIFFIIAVAELMHIFIHFYIGHLQEEHGSNNYIKFKNMIIVQTLLTIGLSGIIYLEGQVSSHIAIIQGNTLYKNSLTSLNQNKLSWFLKEYSVKIANKFNHDYEQVFIALHMLLNIYKNLVILIATIYFLSQSKTSLIFMTLGITVTYFTVYIILRTVERKVVNYYEEYKYHYVKVLQQSIGGAKLFSLYQVSQQVQKNAKNAYLQSASYKIAQSYTSYGEQIFCDLVSLVIFTAVLNYGLQSKVEGNSKSIALIATMIHLLIGVFDVLKTIVKDSVNFETFFKINLMPFVEVIKQKTPQTIRVEKFIEKSMFQYQQSRISSNQRSRGKSIRSSVHQKTKQEKVDLDNVVIGVMTDSVEVIHSSTSSSKLLRKNKRKSSIDQNFLLQHQYGIHFNNVILHQSKYHQPVFQVYPLNLHIQPGQKVLICQSNDILKNYIIYGLTKNLPMFFNTQIMGYERTNHEINFKQKTILIGGRDICCIQKSELQLIVQVIVDHDFYIQGNLEDNISWKNPRYDQKKALKLAQFLSFKQDLPQLKEMGMKTPIKDPSKQLIKKITFLRILSLQPKIIIIKDTQSIIGRYHIVQELRRILGAITIIKISSNIAEAFDIDRVILTKNMRLIEDRHKNEALIMPFSQVGKQLRNANIDGLIYTNQMTSTLANIRYTNTL